jgi:hypothetical protein
MHIEVKIENSNRGISDLIEEIIKMGGHIVSVYKKEPSLEEVFSDLLSKGKLQDK